jgi:serine/threonine protein kinase
MLKENAVFSVEQTRLLASNVLDALAYLHANDIVHRHVGSSSVFFDHSGRFVLADHAVIKRLEEIHRFSQNEVGEMVSNLRGWVSGALDFARISDQLVTFSPTVGRKPTSCISGCFSAPFS